MYESCRSRDIYCVCSLTECWLWFNVSWNLVQSICSEQPSQCRDIYDTYRVLIMIQSQVESSAKWAAETVQGRQGAGRRRRRWWWFHWCRGLEAQLVPGGEWWEAQEGRESGLLRKHEGPAGHRVSTHPLLKRYFEYTQAFLWRPHLGTAPCWLFLKSTFGYTLVSLWKAHWLISDLWKVWFQCHTTKTTPS